MRNYKLQFQYIITAQIYIFINIMIDFNYIEKAWLLVAIPITYPRNMSRNFAKLLPILKYRVGSYLKMIVTIWPHFGSSK